uniref:Ig-like domain-containing protein n=1 Tax=Tetraodon nigroviridis TaxID=99883 RepID=H3BZ66_TETNG
LQPSPLLMVKPGHNLTLECLFKNNPNPRISWYKQTLEEKPRLVCVNYRTTGTFYNEFKDHPRFKLHMNNKGANLTIMALELSDSATYYCTEQEFHKYDFIERFNVIVEGPELTLNQSASDNIQSGRSGTPNCSVHTGTCDGNHTVYWFRNSGPSELSLVFSHKGRNNQCEKETNTCFYSLSLKNLDISQTGTYYCAVAACGHIVFGNGSKVEFEDNGKLLIWVYLLSAGWILTIIVVVLLSISIFAMKKKNSQDLLDSQSRPAVAATANTECQSEKEEDHLHYAAVRVNKPNKTRRQRNIPNECVYSGVRC